MAEESLWFDAADWCNASTEAGASLESLLLVALHYTHTQFSAVQCNQSTTIITPLPPIHNHDHHNDQSKKVIHGIKPTQQEETSDDNITQNTHNKNTSQTEIRKKKQSKDEWKSIFPQ